MAMTEQQNPQTDPTARAPWRTAVTIAVIAVAVAAFTVVALAVIDGMLVGALLALYAATIWLSSGRSGASSAVKKNMPSLMGLLLVYFVVLHLVVPAQTYPVYATHGYSMASTLRPASVLVALNWQNNQIYKIVAYLVALVLASQTLFAAKRLRTEQKGGQCAMAADDSAFLGSTGESVKRRAL